MLTFDFNFNDETIRRKMLEAAERQVRDKLRTQGVYDVIVKAVGFQGEDVRFQFFGEDADIQKAKDVLGYQM